MARNNPFTFVDLTGLRLVRTTAGMSDSVTMTMIPVCTNTDDLKKWHRKDMLASWRRDLPVGRNALLRTSFETKMSVWNFARTARS